MDVVIEEHDGIFVVRDDLLLGGTKIRFLKHLFEKHDEIVYATPAYGGAQLALAYGAKQMGKKATIFVAQRNSKHPRTIEAEQVGAKIIETFPRYLNVLQSRAKKYANENSAFYLEFGGDSINSNQILSELSKDVWNKYGPFDEVWTAAGSGVLTRGLQNGMPESVDFYAVQVGKTLTNDDVGRANILVYPIDFSKELKKIKPPFPSCPNYDRKAWDFCKQYSKGKVLFWNVMGPSPTKQ